MKSVKKNLAVNLGLIVTLLFLVMVFYRFGFLDTLDYKVYDMMMGLRGEPEEVSQVVMVEIDDDSIEKLGRWPWSRDLIAQGLRKIAAGNPKVVGLNIILSELENSAGLYEIKRLEDLFSRTVYSQTGASGLLFLEAMREARGRLDHDAALAAAISDTGNVVLPVYFKGARFAGQEESEPSPLLVAQSVQNVRGPSDLKLPRVSEIVTPIEPFFQGAEGVGHINLVYDMDGTARRERLIYEYNGLYVPSYSLKLATLFLNVAPDSVRVELGTAVYLDDLAIPTTMFNDLLVSFKGERGSFKRYSFFDVVSDKIPASVFKSKLVLVSPSAAGIVNPLSTPTDPTMPLGEFSAHTVWSILNRQFIEQPPWSPFLELGMILVVGVLLAFVMPRLKAAVAGGAFVFILAAMLAGSSLFFVGKGLWIQLTYPMVQLVVGYIGVVSVKYFFTEADKAKVEGESAETNRMLGLSFQSQGMLDMAFDKLKKVPVDKEMKEILYNLGLDYERKRQFSKAVSVYEHIESADKKFKDISERKQRLIKVNETMIFGEGVFGSSSDPLLASGSGTLPTLGRYEVSRQLGRGAMGIVYLGKDPRINRTTAIKTFTLGEDLDKEETDKLKAEFFREAESAGTLSHPNIVTIYDAGEEHDLAYIAMEYLEGTELKPYTRKDSLLPIRKVVDYGADIADALDYAHQRGIVHRDIKPSNVMLLKNGTVKITDFGIARIAASSQTQTGVIKGTPYYMSPEQIAGEKVDGRSDIFSLGTMLFQLLTGEVPFYAESPAGLVNKIMNVRHPDPRRINPKVPSPLCAILDKALAKEREKRYQRASAMAGHLRELGVRMDNLASKRKSRAKSTTEKGGGGKHVAK